MAPKNLAIRTRHIRFALRIFPVVLAFSTNVAYSQRPAFAVPSVETIRTNALQALSLDVSKLHDLCTFSRTQRARFTEIGSGLSGPFKQEHRTFVTPGLKSHQELLEGSNGEVGEIVDGWEDQEPLSVRYPDPKTRRGVSDPNTLASYRVRTAALLAESRNLRLVAVVSDRGRRAYAIESRPSPEIPSGTGPERCAASLVALFLIDAETYFPLRLDTLVVSPEMCPASGATLGEREQRHFVELRKQIIGGSPVEIWAFADGLKSLRITSPLSYCDFPSAPGAKSQADQLVYRRWQFGMPLQGADILVTSQMNDWKLCVTGTRFHFDGEMNTSPQDESAEKPLPVESYFRISDPKFPFFLKQPVAVKAGAAHSRSIRR